LDVICKFRTPRVRKGWRRGEGLGGVDGLGVGRPVANERGEER